MACTSSRARNGRGRIARDDAVAQHHDSIGHLLDLDEVVRHEQHGDAARGETAYRQQQAFALTRRQARGGLVEDEHLHLMRQRPGDHHLLAVAGRQRLDRGVDVDVQPGVLGDRSGGSPCPPGAAEQPSGAGRQRVEREVVGDARTRHDAGVDLLVDRLDAGAAGVQRCRRGERLAADVHRPARSADRPGEDLDQRRLAGTVGADEADDLSGGDVEGNPAEDLARSVALGQLRDPQRRRSRVDAAGVSSPVVGPRSARSLGGVRRAMGSERDRVCSVPERRRSAGRCSGCCRRGAVAA